MQEQGQGPDPLVAEYGSVVRALHRNVGLDSQEIGEGAAFLIGELSPHAVGGEHGLALRQGHLTQIVEGTSHQEAAVRRERAELSQRAVELLALLRSQVFECFVVREPTTALLWRHAVKKSKLIVQAQLGLRRKVAKAGFVFQCVLLLR